MVLLEARGGHEVLKSALDVTRRNFLWDLDRAEIRLLQFIPRIVFVH